METTAITLRKIPLGGFIDILITLFNKGADYVDLIGVPNEIQDEMSIVVRTEYINPEYNGFVGDEFTPEEQGIVTEKKLTDEDFKDLLS
jgi:hypothetical protein